MPYTTHQWQVSGEVPDSEASDVSSDPLDKQLEAKQESQPSERCRICIYNTECRAWKHETGKNLNKRIRCAICQVSVHMACAFFASTNKVLDIRIYICSEIPAFAICLECRDNSAVQKIDDLFSAIVAATMEELTTN